ncbi:MAG: hypothetical protein M3081_16390 [Gemmatimonadota bacterium]|nr:hypothetical protein [Gemmatimonadota bacterium]
MRRSPGLASNVAAAANRRRPFSRVAGAAAIVAASLIAVSCQQDSTAPRAPVATPPDDGSQLSPSSAKLAHAIILTCTLPSASLQQSPSSPQCTKSTSSTSGVALVPFSANMLSAGATAPRPATSAGSASPPFPVPPQVPFAIGFGGVSFEASTRSLSLDIAILNNGEDPIGTPDGQTVTGVFAFAPVPPQVLQGSGSVTLLGYDGIGTLTGPNQPFFTYPQIVGVGEFSGLRRWTFQLAGEVLVWNFAIAVVADAPKPPTLLTITAGYYHTCGLDVKRNAYCWGNGEDGQRGDGSVVQEQSTPVAVKAPVGMAQPLIFAEGQVSLSAGGVNKAAHTCGLLAIGRAYCWGNGAQGQLGDGNSGAGTRSTVPTLVQSNVRFGVITAGGEHTCALTQRTADVAEGLAYCWGKNTFGQLGDESTTGRSSPVAVKGGIEFRVISAGETHTCAISLRNEAWCWGEGTFGQRGDNTTKKEQTIPKLVSATMLFRTITAGIFHTCALTPAGKAFCWGNDEGGQLGDGRTVVKDSTPVAVKGDIVFASIDAGGLHTCGISTTGKTYCWGFGESGQRGDNSAVDKKSTPQLVIAPPAVTFNVVSAGGFHTCALTKETKPGGKAYCWGFNFAGQVGNGTTDKSLVPLAVKPLP